MNENIGKIYGDMELIEYLGNWNDFQKNIIYEKKMLVL